MNLPPVITIDGPSASGKGTLATCLAQRLGFHYLDSGAIYRAFALFAEQQGQSFEASNEFGLAKLAQGLPLVFGGSQVFLAGQDVSQAIRSEATGKLASLISVLPKVRESLLGRQLLFRQAPGLVADGRDMGTVVFPDAVLKVFLTASAESRAARRVAQLQATQAAKLDHEPENPPSTPLNEVATMPQVLADLIARDHRDSSRSIGALRAAPDARLLDNSNMNVESSLALVLGWLRELQPSLA